MEVKQIARAFDFVYEKYVDNYGMNFLSSIDEDCTIRMPLLFHDLFLQMATNSSILPIIDSLIKNKFYLTQQNGVINPPRKGYSQGKFHRDLPYQHFVTTRPLAISALYCVDDFTRSNGGTIVIPFSHKWEEFPSDVYVAKHGIVIEAPAGSFILFDSMLFHRGGFNSTDKPRRAINHVYSIPLIRQQICIPRAMSQSGVEKLTQQQKELLGFSYTSCDSIQEFLFYRRR